MLLGLISWLLIGAIGGVLARQFLPGRPQLGWLGAFGAGLAGALAGGLLATYLGFGGVAAYDARAFVAAALTAMLALLATRLATLAR